MTARVVSQLLNRPRELINAASVFSGPVAPHVAINMTKFTVLFRKFGIVFYFRYKFFFSHFRPPAPFCVFYICAVGVVIPDVHIVIHEVLDVVLTAHEPIKLLQDTVPVHALCGQQWKTLGKVKSDLPAESADRGLALSDIDLPVSCVKEFPHQIKILLFGMSIGHSYFLRLAEVKCFQLSLANRPVVL